MQFRVRVPIILGLLMACCHSSVSAQINSGYFLDGEPVVEPFYDAGRTGSYLDPAPNWLGQATFDILLFDRSDADSRTIVTESGTGNPILNTTDLGFPVTAGFRFNLVLTGDDGCDFVFNYLGAKFDNSRVHSVAAANYDFFEFAALSPASGADFQTSYMSKLSSVEVNSRTRQWSRFAPLAGVRFMTLADEFDRMSGDASSMVASTLTDNDLWGFQIGGEALLWETGSARLQSTIKGGVFYNDLKLRTDGGVITTTNPFTMATTTTDPTASFSSDHISFFGELNIEYSYRICPQVSIRAGYTAMWLDGVALAPDQHDNFLIGAGIGNFDYGTVLYHGSYVGFELIW